MIGVELVRDRQTKERAVEERNALVQAMFRRGVLILGAGRNAVRLAPPLVLSTEQADQVLKIFDEALGEKCPLAACPPSQGAAEVRRAKASGFRLQPEGRGCRASRCASQGLRPGWRRYFVRSAIDGSTRDARCAGR